MRDHLGNNFRTVKEMAEYWEIKPSTLYKRLKHLSIAEALTIKKPDKITDHKGNIFNSLREVAKHWEISENTLRTRLYVGWSLQKALESPVESNISSEDRKRYRRMRAVFSKVGKPDFMDGILDRGQGTISYLKEVSKIIMEV